MCFVIDGQTYQVGHFFVWLELGCYASEVGIFVGAGVAFKAIQIGGHCESKLKYWVFVALCFLVVFGSLAW